MSTKARDGCARVAAVRTLAPDVLEADLSMEDPRALDFDAGQWISVPFGPKIVRAYSIASPPSTRHVITLCADVLPNGVGSRWFRGLTVGEQVRFKGPLGGFVYPAGETRRPLFVAEEIGIVPIRSIALALAGRAALGSGVLLYASPDPRRLVYDADFRHLARTEPAFVYRPVVGAPPGRGGDALVAELERLATSLDDVVAYVAGGEATIKRVRDLLVARGMARKSVRWERFW